MVIEKFGCLPLSGSQFDVGKRIVLRLTLPFSFQRVTKGRKVIRIADKARVKAEVFELRGHTT